MPAAAPSGGTESWDDDFVFNTGTPPNTKGKSRRQRVDASSPRRASNPADANNTVRASPRRQPPALAAWAEPGPSTPPKRTISQAEESWDDDFEDHASSPAAQRVATRSNAVHGAHSKVQRVISEQENWDDDFADDRPKDSAKTANNGGWDSSDEEDAFGDLEDRTVTARNRRTVAVKYSPPPPVPPLPPSFGVPPPAFPPGSPALSSFSIPTSSNPRDSIGYASLSHIPLRTGSTSALAILPPSPPIHRERRRLRKKSRPSDANVFELLEHNASLPEMPSPSQPSPPELPSANTPPESSNHHKPKILTRVGSLKKWGGRMKRSSTGPAEVLETETTPRALTSQQQPAASSPSMRQPSGWFFRGSGGQLAEHVSGSPPAADAYMLKHERSITRLRSFSYALDSPTKKGKKSAALLGRQSGTRSATPASQSESPGSSPRRRPVSMQVPVSSNSKPIFPRQASHGAIAFGHATSSHSTFSASTDEVHLHGSSGSQEGHRSFMSGIRRISLVGKHRRADSSSGPVSSPFTPAPPLPQLPAPRISRDELLPPIELQPPSPPRQRHRDAFDDTIASTSAESEAASETSIGLLLRPSFDASQSVPSLASPSVSALATPRTSPKLAAASASPQAASLGRSTQPPSSSSTTIVPRRNSLGDLKIPARISQAQVNLKRDLTMVREFAASVDKLSQLHELYNSLVQDAEAVIAEHATTSRPPSRAMSPTAIFKSRTRSNTNPDPRDPRSQFASAFYAIDAKYKISWECAELLVELGGGAPPNAPATPPPSTPPEPRKNRERAVTLAGDESQPSSLPAANAQLGWRASTGRNDLSARQLSLLKEMLNKDATDRGHIPEEATMIVNRSWRWGDAMSSTVTLPSEESSVQSSSNNSPTKKRRNSRLGMRGLRDMLKSIAKGAPSARFHMSTVSATISTDSSLNTHGLPVPSTSSQNSHYRRPKSSIGPDSTSSSHHATSPHHSQSLGHKSPRRPSIASIFRFTQKSKASPTIGPSPLPSSSAGSIESEEDWDRVEDFQSAAGALGVNKDSTATIRGRKSRSPYGQHAQISTPKKAHSSRSSLSLRNTSGSDLQVPLPTAPLPASSSLPVVPASALPPHTLAFTRPTRLSNVEEAAEHSGAENAYATQQARKRISRGRASQSPRRPSSRGSGMNAGSASSRRLLTGGSVRSVAPPTVATTKLAMTPENIKPLLESAREVHSRCTACIEEIRVLLAVPPAATSPPPGPP